MLSPDVPQQLFEIRPAPFRQSRRISALIERRRQKKIRRCEPDQAPHPPESLLEFPRPPLAPDPENLLIAHAKKRTPQNPHQSNRIQRIHQRRQKGQKTASLARFKKRPAAAHQKRNLEAVERPLKRLRSAQSS